MEVLIHIGDAKCGSSSIQASLFEKKADLLDQGILYYPASKANGHYSYITLVNGKTRGDDSEQINIAQRNIKETSELIAKHNPSFLLISAENLFGIPQELLAKLIDKILGFEAKKHIISFVRHPVDFYLSTVQQQLKADHEFTPPKTFSRDLTRPFRFWKERSDCASMTVRIFSSDRMKNGSVVAEFTSILRDLTKNENLNLPDNRTNTSLSAEQMIILQNFRRDFLSKRSGQFSPESSRIISLFTHMNNINGKIVGTKPTLINSVLACVMENNARFISDIDTFFPHLEMAEVRPELPTGWREQATNWTANIASILASHNSDLVRKLTSLIPEYNQNLAKGRTDTCFETIRTLVTNPEIDTAYTAYLESAGVPNISSRNQRKISNSPKKILILGTSNSILRGGWSTGFTQNLPNDTVIHNKSIGGSPGTQFAAWCDHDLSDYDCVIIDSIVNDENMMARNLIGDISFYSKLIHEIFSTIASQTNLVVLGFCNERFAKNRSDIYKIHRDTARNVGGTFFSVIDFALEKRGPKFRDGAHIAIPIARSFGESLAQNIGYHMIDTPCAKSFRENFSTIRIDDLSSVETVTRESRLFSETFSRLRPGDVVEFETVGQLIGFQVDSYDTYGFVRLTNGNDETLIQSVRYPHEPSKFLAYFTPVANGFPAKRLEVLERAETSVPSMHEEPQEPAPKCRLAISTATFWRGG